jgi:Subtilisin inhibitor-like
VRPRHRAAGLFVLACVLVVTSASSTAAASQTALRITVWPRGTQESSKTWTLRCAPVGGTLPQPARACRTLYSLSAPFRPIPKNAVCTEIYGGPAVALVSGTFRGRQVWTRFKRTDGCQIARWARLAVLLPITV